MTRIQRNIDVIPEEHRAKANDLLYRVNRILTQQKKDKNKLYALHMLRKLSALPRCDMRSQVSLSQPIVVMRPVVPSTVAYLRMHHW